MTKRAKVCCYYCLKTDMKEADIKERTGGLNQDALCPNCGIDSIGYFRTFHSLYKKHCGSFHGGISFRNNADKEERIFSCGHKFCADWDKQVMKIRDKTKEWDEKA